MLKGVNWIAVIIAVVLIEGLGFLWYGPLFGSAWTAALGHAVDTSNANRANMLMGLGVVNSLIVVLGLSWLMRMAGAATLMAALTTAFWGWLFFAGTTQALEYLYMGMSGRLVAINMGYLVVAFLIAGATGVELLFTSIALTRCS